MKVLDLFRVDRDRSRVNVFREEHRLESDDLVDETKVTLELRDEVIEAHVLQVDEDPAIALLNGVRELALAPVIELRQRTIETRDDVLRSLDHLLRDVGVDVGTKNVDSFVFAGPFLGRRRCCSNHVSSWSGRPQLEAGARKGGV